MSIACWAFPAPRVLRVDQSGWDRWDLKKYDELHIFMNQDIIYSLEYEMTITVLRVESAYDILT